LLAVFVLFSFDKIDAQNIPAGPGQHLLGECLAYVDGYDYRKVLYSVSQSSNLKINSPLAKSVLQWHMDAVKKAYGLDIERSLKCTFSEAGGAALKKQAQTEMCGFIIQACVTSFVLTGGTEKVEVKDFQVTHEMIVMTKSGWVRVFQETVPRADLHMWTFIVDRRGSAFIPINNPAEKSFLPAMVPVKAVSVSAANAGKTEVSAIVHNRLPFKLQSIEYEGYETEKPASPQGGSGRLVSAHERGKGDIETIPAGDQVTTKITFKCDVAKVKSFAAIRVGYFYIPTTWHK
jgi:hypothetical protein